MGRKIPHVLVAMLLSGFFTLWYFGRYCSWVLLINGQILADIPESQIAAAFQSGRRAELITISIFGYFPFTFGYSGGWLVVPGVIWIIALMAMYVVWRWVPKFLAGIRDSKIVQTTWNENRLFWRGAAYFTSVWVIGWTAFFWTFEPLGRYKHNLVEFWVTLAIIPLIGILLAFGIRTFVLYRK